MPEHYCAIAAAALAASAVRNELLFTDAQRLSTVCVVYGAAAILDALKAERADRLRAA